jgi:hypothetical protein
VDILLDVLKIYGPMALGWVFFSYLFMFFLKRYEEDISSRVKLAEALQQLATLIERNK